jgi:hypothetical protein
MNFKFDRPLDVFTVLSSHHLIFMSFGGTDNFIGVVKFVGQILFYVKELLEYRINSGTEVDIFRQGIFFLHICLYCHLF